MESNSMIDLRIHDLCRNKLKLGDSDAAIMSKCVQLMFAEERDLLLKHYTEIERKDRKDFEEALDVRVGLMVEQVNNLHKDMFEKKIPGVNNTDILQWMFTYFAFVMGGVVAILLILLKK